VPHSGAAVEHIGGGRHLKIVGLTEIRRYGEIGEVFGSITIVIWRALETGWTTAI
jgi:hypothetical protein